VIFARFNLEPSMITEKPKTGDISEQEDVIEDDAPLEFFNPWDNYFSGAFKANEREFEF
jgi:hypothetical protein